MNLCLKDVLQKVNVINKLIIYHRFRPEFQESESWYLLHVKAPAHSSGVVSEFLAKRWIPMLRHSLYFPAYAAATFFISKIKNCNERDEIRGSFSDPTDSNERTEGDTERFSRASDSL
jgi:hypothetical protein